MDKKTKMKSTLDNLFSSRLSRLEKNETPPLPEETADKPAAVEAKVEPEVTAVDKKPRKKRETAPKEEKAVIQPVIEVKAAESDAGRAGRQVEAKAEEIVSKPVESVIEEKKPDPPVLEIKKQEPPVQEIKKLETARPEMAAAIQTKTFEEKTLQEEKFIELTDNKDSGKEEHLVVFKIADESFGVRINVVESIIKMQAITEVPNTPEYIQGITNLRGTVLPVINLRKRFGLPEIENTVDTRIVVINTNGDKNGVIVDSVSEVLRVPSDSIEPPPPMATTLNTSYISGVGKFNDSLVILLDLNNILQNQRIAEF